MPLPPKLLDYIPLRAPPYCARPLALTWQTPQVVELCLAVAPTQASGRVSSTPADSLDNLRTLQPKGWFS